MELKQIKELMTAMERAGIKKMRIKEKTGFELDLERQDDGATTHHAPPPHYYEHPRFVAPVHHHPVREEAAPPPPPAPKEEKGGKYISSPMVGTFYSCSSPDDPPFLKVGDQIDENTVVCIIEAMKVMNEVKSGVSGTVAEILVENAHPVEFGTKIFRIV